jgi:hypothetical protein
MAAYITYKLKELGNKLIRPLKSGLVLYKLKNAFLNQLR